MTRWLRANFIILICIGLAVSTLAILVPSYVNGEPSLDSYDAIDDGDFSFDEGGLEDSDFTSILENYLSNEDSFIATDNEVPTLADDQPTSSDNVQEEENDTIYTSHIATGEVRTAWGYLASGPKGTITFSWQNPEEEPIIITRAYVYVKTPSEATAEMDVGTTTSADGHGDDMLAYIDLTRADTIWEFTGTAPLDGKNGETDFMTGKIIKGNALELDGIYYITYEGA